LKPCSINFRKNKREEKRGPTRRSAVCPSVSDEIKEGDKALFCAQEAPGIWGMDYDGAKPAPVERRKKRKKKKGNASRVRGPRQREKRGGGTTERGGKEKDINLRADGTRTVC